jgi:hypothetical protein
MLDSTEQGVLTPSPLVLSVGTLTALDNLLDTDFTLLDEMVAHLTNPDAKAATEAALAPYREIPKVELVFIQDEEEND